MVLRECELAEAAGMCAEAAASSDASKHKVQNCVNETHNTNQHLGHKGASELLAQAHKRALLTALSQALSTSTTTSGQTPTAIFGDL